MPRRGEGTNYKIKARCLRLRGGQIISLFIILQFGVQSTRQGCKRVPAAAKKYSPVGSREDDLETHKLEEKEVRSF